MKANVTEIAADVYRISTFHPEYGIQFNQFLIKDDEPFIMHTGFKKMFPITLGGRVENYRSEAAALDRF